jgi:hypothetical protein
LLHIYLTFYFAFVPKNGIKVKGPDRRIFTTLGFKFTAGADNMAAGNSSANKPLSHNGLRYNSSNAVFIINLAINKTI